MMNHLVGSCDENSRGNGAGNFVVIVNLRMDIFVIKTVNFNKIFCKTVSLFVTLTSPLGM
jgi:hypothetical protein